MQCTQGYHLYFRGRGLSHSIIWESSGLQGATLSESEWTQRPIEPVCRGQNWEVICTDVNKAPFNPAVDTPWTPAMMNGVKINGGLLFRCQLNCSPQCDIRMDTGTRTGRGVDSRYWQDGTDQKGAAKDVASPASCTQSPAAAFNLCGPWLICFASPGTQSPNEALKSGSERSDFAAEGHSKATTAIWEITVQKRKTIAASLHQLDVGSANALLKDSSSPKPTRSSEVKTQTMLYEVIDLCTMNTVLPVFFEESLDLIVIQETQNHWVPASPPPPHLVHWLL